MHFSLPAPVEKALSMLTARGYEAYVVGGCVRDLLMGIAPHDYDICTGAMPEETKACFAGERVIETGIQHGTVTVLMGGEPLEITTFRTDGDYLDGRHPSSVSFTRNIENDLMRRDFTVNAMAYHPQKGLVDLYCGQEDIRAKILRCVGDAHTRLTEDALRILRAVRFSAQLDFAIEKLTAQAMIDLKDRLSLVSRERIAQELLRMIAYPAAPKVLRQFEPVFFAALPQCKKIDIEALTALPAGDPVLRLAALLHENGPESAENALKSLKLSTQFTQECLQLIAHYDAVITPREVPVFLAKLGETQFRRLLLLQHNASLLSEMQRALSDKLPLSVRELAVNGRDLIAAGVPAGPMVGEVLGKLHEAVLLREVANEREKLLEMGRMLLSLSQRK